MNTKELMEALLAGKKVTLDNWLPSSYFHLVDGVLRNQDGHKARLLDTCYDWKLYVKNKKKVKKTMYQFIYRSNNSGLIVVGSKLYEDSNEDLGRFYTKIKVIEHEIEVEA